mgnify:CR=1 FL=1
MRKNIYLKKNISLSYFKKSLFSKDKIKLTNIIKNIFTSLDDKKDTFHSFSKKFDINFKILDLKKFNNFKSVVLIGMGGSILGAEAIYSFFNNILKSINKYWDHFQNSPRHFFLVLGLLDKTHHMLLLITSYYMDKNFPKTNQLVLHWVRLHGISISMKHLV